MSVRPIDRCEIDGGRERGEAADIRFSKHGQYPDASDYIDGSRQTDAKTGHRYYIAGNVDGSSWSLQELEAVSAAQLPEFAGPVQLKPLL